MGAAQLIRRSFCIFAAPAIIDAFRAVTIAKDREASGPLP